MCSFNRLFHCSSILLHSAGGTLVPITLRGSFVEPRAYFTVFDEAGHKKESVVKLLDNPGHAYLSTDKPIYTPREDVRIRFARLGHDLKPSRDWATLKLRIKASTTYNPCNSLHAH